MNAQGQDSVVYFTILMVIETVVLILSLIFESSLTMFCFIMLLSLVGAKCMNTVIWVIQFIIFAIICALYSFDPVGLWISGHGQNRTGAQNSFCLIIFLLISVSIYIGYLYYQAFGKELVQDFVGQGYSNPNGGAYQGVYQGGNQDPNQNQGGNQGVFGGFPGFGGFGGGNNDAGNGQSNQNQGGFQQFSGQGYRL